jgi:hypothetical protein
VAGHFSFRTFGVRPAPLHEVELEAVCSARVVLQVCQALTSKSAVSNVLLVVLMMTFTNPLLVTPLLVRDNNSFLKSRRPAQKPQMLKVKIADSGG